MKILAIALLLFASTAVQAQDQRVNYPDGRTKEVFWVENGRTEFIKYHQNGRVEERGAFAHGKPEGIWKHYDADGKLLSRVQFANGLRNGRCLYTNIDGRTQYRLQYDHGKLVHGAEFDASGEQVAERGSR